MNTNRQKWLSAAAAAAALALAACAGSGAGAKERSAGGGPRDPMEVTVSGGLLGQVETGEPSWAEVAGALRVAARVEADETRLARVSAPVTGRIVELEAVEGQTVRRGDLIALIRSKELSDAQSDFLKAQSQRRLAERAVERAKHLLQADVIGEAELQRREAELVQTTAEVLSLRDQLRVLGTSEDELTRLEAARVVNSQSQVLATIDGTVLERRATIGQVVQAAEVVCVLADLSRVWLVADVPEQSSGSLHMGQPVEAEIPAIPGHIIHGKLSFVGATVNSDTRTVRVRIDLPNPNGKYKPAMLATMLLADRAQRQQVVPAAAVVREGNREHLFVRTAERTFQLRPVTLGGDYGPSRVLLSGLRPGETIVVKGAFHLNNERKRQALQGAE
jgi:cobalt-zinc-cadmium efflux system membrane fusion protein